MKSNYDVLGNHIRLIDTRNTDLVTEQVLGINIDKFFMPSVANVIGTDLSKYKLITKGKFACNPMHVGRDERLPVALYTEDTPAIVSPAYFMFEIVDSSVLNEEYLMMWFRRPEFDRLCWLRTDGSVRGGITWDDICRIEIPVPPMDEQMEIVSSYRAITDRIALKKQINDNLEATAQAYFDKLFINDFECTTNLDKIANINPTRNLAKNQIARCFDMSTLPLKGCIPVGGEYKPYNGGMRFINGDTILARITPCLENGKAAYINILDESEVAFGSTEYIVLSPKENVPSSFFYFLARNSTFISYAIAHMNGSSGRQRVSGSDIANYPIKEPSKDKLQMFDKYASKVLYEMKVSALEIEKLKELQENITATISGR